MCIGIIWNNSFLVGGRARAEARIDPRPLLTSRSTAHGAQVVWPLDYMGSADKVSNHALLCHLKWPVFLHCLAKWGNMKIAFSLKCCISALPEFNLLLLDFFSLFDSRLILEALAAVWLPKSCNQCVQLRAVGGASLRKKEVESILQQFDCVARTMHQCAVFLKEKCRLWCVW